MKRNKIRVVSLLLCFVFLLVACQPSVDMGNDEWQRLKDSSENSVVNLYAWTENETFVAYINEVIAPKLNEKYKIRLQIMNDDKETLFDSLKSDKENKKELGAIDLIWFENAADYNEFQQAGLLYTNFSKKLEDFSRYFNKDDLDLQYFDDVKIKNNFVPFNKQLLTFYYDQDAVYDPPLDLETLKVFLKDNLASFTYPEPEDAVGGAFLRSVILNFVDVELFFEKDLTDEEVKTLVKPAIDYLKEIKPYLYQMGKEYPKSERELSNLFAEQKIIFTMSLDYLHANKLLNSATYPMATRAFIVGNSIVSEQSGFSIAFNADNKAGAMLTINELMSDEVQIDKLKSKTYYGLPAYSYGTLGDKDKKAISKAIRKKDIVKVSELLALSKHDIPAKYHQIINEYWREEILTEEKTEN